MNTHEYLFTGLVLPERATLSIGPLKPKYVRHVNTGKELSLELNIVLNQISVWVRTSEEWDIYDLRNIARHFAQTVCSLFALLKGLAYDVEIRHVLNPALGIDFVFGIEVETIAKRQINLSIPEELPKLLQKVSGEHGIHINRAILDLNSALKDTEDTAFYCFRSLESLKQYCKYKFDLKTEKEQWARVAEMAGRDRDYIDSLKSKAFPERHGDISTYSAADRADMLNITWDVIEAFLKKIE